MNSTAAATYRPAEGEVSLRTLNEAGRRAYLALFFAEHFLGRERYTRFLGQAGERNRARMLEYFADWPRNESRPVREVTFTSHAAFYRNHRPVWEPVVFRGAAKNWAAVKQWDFDFFARNYAETKAVMGDQHGLFGEGESGRYEVSTIGKLIAEINGGEKRCLRFSPILEENPQLKDYLDMPWYGAFRGPLSMRGFVQLFVAPAATYTPIHCALESNVFVQVHGRKRWLLYPGACQPLLDPPADRRPYFHSDFLPGRPRPQSPLGVYAPAYEVLLDPGDVLYFGPFVWHYVENLTPSIAAAYRFFSIRHGVRSSWPLTLAKFLATKPSLLHTLYYSLTNTNFYYKPKVD